jgi:hypothetical protein
MAVSRVSFLPPVKKESHQKNLGFSGLFPKEPGHKKSRSIGFAGFS